MHKYIPWHQVAHRQKPELEVTVPGKSPPVYLDCPSVRCKIRHSDGHSNSSRAYIKPVAFVMKGLVYDFPRKTDPEYNKNVLFAFESHARYPRQLYEKQFYHDIDVLATHATAPSNRNKWTAGVAEQLDSSYANLPAAMYRDLGVCVFMCVYVCTRMCIETQVCVCVCVCKVQ